MAQREPVRVMKNGREQAVLISEKEYADYLEFLKKQQLITAMDAIGQEAKKRGLTPEILDDLLKDLS